MKMENHPQVAVIVSALLALADETERIDVTDLPLAQPSALTYTAIWQGFQIACDLFVEAPELMREIYLRERWGSGPPEFRRMVIERLRKAETNTMKEEV